MEIFLINELYKLLFQSNYFNFCRLFWGSNSSPQVLGKPTEALVRSNHKISAVQNAKEVILQKHPSTTESLRNIILNFQCSSALLLLWLKRITNYNINCLNIQKLHLHAYSNTVFIYLCV